MLDKLEFMIALSREQHFGRAAESCGVAQPTLSLGIQSLEQMLNTPLVKRASRFQGFTPEGERVLVWAHRLVGDARAMRQDLLGLKSGTDSHLRIAAIPSAMPLVARLTVPLQLRHPNVRFTVLGRTSTVLLNMLRQREIEAGVTYLSNEPIGDVSAIPIYREEYLLLTTADGPFGDAIDGTAGYKVKPGFLVIAPDKDRHVPRRTRRELRRRRLCQHHAVAGGQFGRQVALRRALQSGSARVCEGELRR